MTRALSVPAVRLAVPVCGDWVQLARTMRPDEIAQFEAMTGRDYNADQAAGAFIAAPGIKYALIGADSAAFAAGCFEHVRPGVIETWGVGTLPAWSQHWRAITKVCRRQIDSFLANGAHRVQIVSLASRTAAHAWYERGLGLQREGTLRRYFPDGSDAVMHAKVRP